MAKIVRRSDYIKVDFGKDFGDEEDRNLSPAEGTEICRAGEEDEELGTRRWSEWEHQTIKRRLNLQAQIVWENTGRTLGMDFPFWKMPGCEKFKNIREY